ncbi:MAG: type II toxin-antitoxin system VapC family toxin [Proteobacteria bacterium]|nr:type II toxin-antitoxin system VapC family toxin [Pseudomonadota bacterium]
MQKHPNVHLLLDTHIFIWLMNGDKSLSSDSQNQIEKVVAEEGGIGISAISLWEIGTLYSRNKILLNQPCLSWLTHSLQAPGIHLIELTPEIAVESCSLPNEFHGDPADRIIVATSRILDAPLLTRDQKILTYGKGGFVKSIRA